MAIISPNTFDPLKRYVGVRLQQGVPIVDADWNEMEDVRQFELRAFLKWFVGDGVPQGNDGFRLDGSSSLTNNFIIRSGVPPAGGGVGTLETGLRHVGRCMVEGLDVTIETDIQFTGQPLHVDQPGSTALSSTIGVPPIAGLGLPTSDHTVTAYLDVWDRLVTPSEDPDLVHTGLGTESCARLRREWVVRVRDDAGVPVTGDGDYLAGHYYYALANITRRTGFDAVDEQDIKDLREQRLLMPPSTLISDLFDISPDSYRRGEGRPNISLRTAINALLRGELPTTPEVAVTSDPAEDVPSRQTIKDINGHTWVFWTRSNNIWTQRLRDNTWDAEVGLTTNALVLDREPMTRMDSSGDIWLFWQRRISSSNRQLWYRIYRQSTRTWDAEVQVSTGTGRAQQPYAVEDATGNIWLFYRFNSDIWAQQYVRATDTWGAPDQRSSNGTSSNPFALVDAGGQIWLFYEGNRSGVTGRKIYSQFLSGGTWSIEEARSNAVTSDNDSLPCAIQGNADSIWLFWSNTDNVTNHRAQSVTFDSLTSTWSTIDNVYLTSSSNALEPAVILDTDGSLWLFLVNYSSSSSSVVLVTRRLTGASSWTSPMNLTQPGELNRLPSAVQDTNGVINLFWQGERAGNRDIYYRQIVPTI